MLNLFPTTIKNTFPTKSLRIFTSESKMLLLKKYLKEENTNLKEVK